MSDLIDDLERLTKLKQTGAVSDEEFEAGKRHLLSVDVGAAPPSSSSELEVEQVVGQMATSSSLGLALHLLALISILMIVSIGLYKNWGDVSQFLSDFSGSKSGDFGSKKEDPAESKNSSKSNPESKPEYSDTATTNGLAFTFGSRLLDTFLSGKREFNVLTNVGKYPAHIKWVRINNRDDCLAVPIYNDDKSHIASLSVLSDDSTANVADSLTLNVGQYVTVFMPSACGDFVRMKVGTDAGDVDSD